VGEGLPGTDANGDVEAIMEACLELLAY